MSKKIFDTYLLVPGIGELLIRIDKKPKEQSVEGCSFIATVYSRICVSESFTEVLWLVEDEIHYLRNELINILKDLCVEDSLDEEIFRELIDR